MKLLLSWTPGSLTPNSETEDFANTGIKAGIDLSIFLPEVFQITQIPKPDARQKLFSRNERQLPRTSMPSLFSPTKKSTTHLPAHFGGRARGVDEDRNVALSFPIFSPKMNKYPYLSVGQC